MSSQTRTLDRAGRLADERVVDALFIVRRKPWHWPVVLAGAVTGFLIGFAITGTAGFFAFSGALIGFGLGMNIGTDFRFIARTPTRVLLIDSSRVIARPTHLVKAVAPERVTWRTRIVSADLDIDGEAHLMARQQIPRLQRMLLG
jgi:hypothetical protein